MSKTAKAALWIMVATMLSKVLGFFREMVLANFYGTGNIADIFVVTLNIPGLIIAVIGSAIATTYIPMYFNTKEKYGEEQALKFTNNVLNICYIMAIVIAVLGLLFTREFVTVFAGGFKGEKFEIAVKFTKIMISGVLFLSGSKLFSSYLQVNDNFVVPGLIGLPYNIIIIASIIISANTNLYVLPAGALLAMSTQLLFQLPFAFKKSYRYKPYVNIKDESIKELAVLVLPMLMGVAIGQLNVFVDRLLGTHLPSGQLAALNYANRLNEFVMALFVTSIITVIYPKLSKMSNQDNNSGYISTIVKSSNCIILVVLPIAIGAIVLAEPIVRILFQRGKFDANSTQLTSIALRLYSVGLLACGIRDVLYRAFYSKSDTKTPMINGSIALAINIVLNLLLIKPLGHAGLAISTSISSIITVVLLFISLKRKTGYFGGDKIIKTGIKSMIASAIMGVVTLFVYNNLHLILGAGMIKELISLSGSVLSGVVVYSLLVIIMKVEEVGLAFDILKKVKNKLIPR
ncbi:murein biosynthesis integral membrane protein MurJ [Asaccharospora irregularis]|uniref:Probable lipid II flippase MurJ n=1 Tax=Asaccharospora irregularis DSM 2635 TaxID=1121321 RepID=A0A1M5PTW1_9FIRM|nr:murein biosynthesis integral membrane protein MurJ [Asaccharospora irregularis]SHH05051.1 putative peptidoglycan lipid II flippase [Asaccharospora irregularis DSM 2635]